MTLSNRQIKSAITGAVRTVESNNGICAKRFTEKQEAVFALRHPNFPEDFFDGYFERNCATGAGITLDFVTDSCRRHILHRGKFPDKRFGNKLL